MLNPVLALILSGLFLKLWLERPAHRHILLFSTGYLGYAAAFGLQATYWPLGYPANGLLSNLFLLYAYIAVIHGIMLRRRQPTPFLALGVLGALGAAGQFWFALVEPDMTGRIYAVNFCYGTMMLVVAACMYSFRNKTPVERVLFAVALTIGLYSFVRTIGVSLMEGHIADRAQYVGSLTWLVLNFSAAFFALLFALTLAYMVVLDAMQDLRAESMTDLLSGLLNRRGFEEHGRRALAHSDRIGVPAVLLICDIDHFKSVNDRFGHVCGDQVITAFGRCLGDAAGGEHVTARIGGEEFAVVLAGANLKTGRLFAEAVRNACSMLRVSGLPEDCAVTASFGVAEKQAGEDLTSLMRRADAALYEAKRRGRDRVRSAEAHMVKTGTDDSQPLSSARTGG
ncbi:MAG: GGDEF domain-containing protein [Hyphomicrobiales bacterium]|nr:GGDEF domain-containing protein [Hyphomicrobiales bacterium]